jgi:hypothetical protein
MKFPLKTSIAALALMAATPSYAASCDASADVNPDALFCVAVDGNINSNSNNDELNAALDDLSTLAGHDLGDVNFLDVSGTKFEGDLDANGLLEFANTLFGEQVISIHFGEAGGGTPGGGGDTVLYLFDFGAGGADSINIIRQGFSNSIIITPPGGVPEPGTWAMMLLGFGAAGFALRRRRTPRLAQVA